MRQVPFGPVRFDVMQLKRKDRKTLDTIEDIQEELVITLNEASGNPITISDASNTYAEDFTVTIEPSQAGTGTPSPDNVRAISGLSSVTVDLNDNTITFSLGSTVYGGTINFSTGVLTINRVGKTFNGTENWTLFGSGSAGAYAMTVEVSPAPKREFNTITVMSNYLQGVAPDATWGNYPSFISTSMSLVSSIIAGINTITTVDDWKTYLASNNLQVVYTLATPTTTQLTAQQIRLLQGENELSTNGSSMSFEYQPDNLIGDLKAWVLDQLS